MKNNSIPASLKDLLVKLDILSMIEANKKLNISNLTFIDKNSWWGTFYRAITGENRKYVMMYINQVINQAVEAIAEYQETEFCAIIVNALASAKIGINNLSTTYHSDPNIIAQINVCVSNIDIQLNKHKTLLQGHNYIKEKQV
jgi:hypothetical protein